MMQFKAVEVMPQITLCSLAWHAPTQTHTRSCLSGCQRPCLPFMCTQNDTREEGREDGRQGDKSGTETRRKMKEKVEEKAVIRRRKCLNCKWVNVTLTAEQPDRHMMELSSLTVLCHCPVKQRVWDIFCHFTSNFLGIGGRKISEKAEGKHPNPRIFLSLSFYHTHTHTVKRPTFPVFEGVLLSRARWGLIPAIPQLILVRI